MSAGRLTFVDALRGLAVLLMVQYHTMDSWLLPEARGDQSLLWSAVKLLGGMAAPLFLLLAGLSQAMAGERALAAGASPRQVARGALDRALWLWGVAYLFRLQLFLAGGPKVSPETLLRVDVLNCMAAALAVSAAGLLVRHPRGRSVAWAAMAAAVALATPPVSEVAWPRAFPRHIADYLAGAPPQSAFPLFPWAAFVFAGAVLGAVLARTAAQGRLARTAQWLAPAGAVVLGAALALDALPWRLYARDDFWRTSPLFFAARVGVILALAGAIYFGDRILAGLRFRPLVMIGRSSLFVYWVHVELVYGGSLRPFKRALSGRQALLGVACVVVFMGLLTWLKQARPWRTRGRPVATPG